MDFSWGSEQQRLYDSVVEFAAEKLNDDVVARDQAGEFPFDLWRRCAEFGVLGWPVPEKVGGSGHSVTTVAFLMEALGYGCRDNGLTFALGAQMWGVLTALMHFGSERRGPGEPRRRTLSAAALSRGRRQEARSPGARHAARS